MKSAYVTHASFKVSGTWFERRRLLRGRHLAELLGSGRSQQDMLGGDDQIGFVDLAVADVAAASDGGQAGVIHRDFKLIDAEHGVLHTPVR